VRAAARVGFVLLASLLLLVCPFLARKAVTTSRSESFAPAARESTPDLRHTGDDRADGVVDLYGNDVSDAVAEYTLDSTGSLYEVHSPHTGLFHLGSPKT